MMTASAVETLGWQEHPDIEYDDSCEGSIWAEATTWPALLITLFITVGGAIKLHYAPMAFGLTATSGSSVKQLAMRVIGLLGMLLLMSTRPRAILNVCLNARSILVLPVLAFASVLWSQSPSQTFTQAAALALTTCFAIYLYVRYPGEQLVSFLSAAAAISLLGCAFAVVCFPGVGIDAFQQNAWRGIFSQRNNCAVDCVCFFVVGLHYRARHFTEYILRGTILFLALLFIVMSGSRTGWLIAAFALGVTFGLRLIQRMPWRDRLLILMLLSIPAGLVIMLTAVHFDSFLNIIGKDPTMSQRTIIWMTVLLPIIKHPLIGYGYAAFWLGLTGESANTILVTGWAENQAQSGYLDILLQLGLLGFVPFVWMLVRGLTRAARALNPLNTVPVQLATVLLLVLIVENVGESGFLASLNLLWFYTLLSLLILDGASKNAEEL